MKRPFDPSRKNRGAAALWIAASVLTLATFSACLVAQPPPNGKDGKGGGAGEQALKELKQKKGKEDAPPANKEPPRNALMLQPGAARQQIVIRPAQAIPWAVATRQELDQVYKALAGNAVDAALFRKVAHFELRRFTDPAEERNVGKIREAISRALRLNTGAADAYMKEILTACQDIFNCKPQLSIFTLVNTLLLLNDIHAIYPNAKAVNGVGLFVNVLQNAEQYQDGILLVAMNCLMEAKEHGLTNVDNEKKGAAGLVRFVDRGDVQPLLLEFLATTLGRLGWAYTGNVPERCEAGTLLASLAANENLPPRTRFEAAIALGSLRVGDPPPIPNWDFEVQAGTVAKTFAAFIDWAAAEELKQPRTTSPSRIKAIAYRFAVSVKAMQDEAGKVGNAKGIQTTEALVQLVAQPTRDFVDNKPPESKPILEWVSGLKVPKLRLTPRAVEFHFVPRIAEQPAQDLRQ